MPPSDLLSTVRAKKSLYIFPLLISTIDPRSFDERVEEIMKEEAARKAREQERVDAIIAARTVHRIACAYPEDFPEA